MSLINQMLKDLERRSKTTSSLSLTSPGLKVSHFSALKQQPAIYIILTIFLLFTLIFVLTKIPVMHKSSIDSAILTLKSPAFVKDAVTPAIETPQVASELHASASIITGLTLQINKPKTLLRIMLSQDALYRISKNINQDYVIVLNHAKLLTTLPSINTSNSAIQAIRMMNQSNGDVLIILSLKAGAELENLALNNEGKFPELQINLIAKDNDTTTEMTQMNAINDIQNTTNAVGNLTKSMIAIGPDVEYQQALSYVTQGQPEKAMLMLTHLLERFPENIPVRESLAKILIDQGKPFEAKKIIEIGLQQHPLHPPYTELKARILANEGQLNDAINLLQTSAPTINKNPEYHALIAALYQRQGQSLLAAKMYEQLLPLQPENSVWWMGLGIAYEDIGKRNEAMQAYARANNGNNLNPELKAYVESRMHSLQ